MDAGILHVGELGTRPIVFASWLVDQWHRRQASGMVSEQLDYGSTISHHTSSITASAYMRRLMAVPEI